MRASIELRLLPRSVDLLALHEANSARYPFLLQSAVRGSANARYDLLLATDGDFLQLHRDGKLTGRGSTASSSFLDALDDWWRAEREPLTHASELPFLGGWFLYLGYELAGQIESKLHLPMPESGLPVALAVRCPAALIHDHAIGETWLVAEPGRDDWIDQIQGDVGALNSAFVSTPVVDALVHEEDPDRYLEFVRRIRGYIRAGDVFQVNVSRQWRGRTCATPDQIYAALRQHNPAPFAGLMQWRGWSVISSSPERLVCRRGDVLETRPIAGTRARSAENRRDLALSGELLAHPKERAEHIMLIDLERNDLGRVSTIGSVQVSELMVLESYAHVHHIVSNVRGRARDLATPGEIIAATFPGGTITGCPKVRCMEIIAELEANPRGAYTGAFGYLDRSGDMDLNILIRTITQHGDQIDLRAGGGIVADSDANAELAETRHKAKGMLGALGV